MKGQQVLGEPQVWGVVLVEPVLFPSLHDLFGEHQIATGHALVNKFLSYGACSCTICAGICVVKWLICNCLVSLVAEFHQAHASWGSIMSERDL